MKMIETGSGKWVKRGKALIIIEMGKEEGLYDSAILTRLQENVICS